MLFVGDINVENDHDAVCISNERVNISMNMRLKYKEGQSRTQWKP